MKKLLCGFVFVGLSMGIATHARAVAVPNPLGNEIFGGDAITSIVGTVASIIASFSEPEMSATVNVEQEEVGALESGSEKFEKMEMSGKATSQGFSTTAYDYVREKLFGSVKFMQQSVTANADGTTTTTTVTTTSTTSGGVTSGTRSSETKITEGTETLGTTATITNMTPYAYFGDSIFGLNIDQAKELIKKEFFIEKDEDMTSEKIAEVKKRRSQYLQTLGTQYAILAQDVQTKLIADMESTMTTPFNGDGLMGAVSGVDQTWLAACRALMADIGLQLELLELDAARFLHVQPYNLLKKPEENDKK